ncbi:MAG: hypothetical protein M1337_03895 [Actinobacteria bacterium]|nr:hypothetical protein [Actinomycetota bacterium]
MTQLSGQSWTSPTLLASFACGVASLVLFVFIEQRRAQPLLDLSILRYPNLAAANAIGLLAQTVAGVFFLMSLYLQVSLGYSTLAAGLTFLPLTVPLVIVAPLGGALTRRLGPACSSQAAWRFLLPRWRSLRACKRQLVDHHPQLLRKRRGYRFEHHAHHDHRTPPAS